MEVIAALVGVAKRRERQCRLLSVQISDYFRQCPVMFRAAAKLRECHRETKQTNPYGTNQNTPPLGNNEHPFGNLPNDPYGNFPRAR